MHPSCATGTCKPHATHVPSRATHVQPHATHVLPHATHVRPNATHVPPHATHVLPLASQEGFLSCPFFNIMSKKESREATFCSA